MTIIVHEGTETQFSFANTEALYLWLKYERKFTASEVVQLATNQSCVKNLTLELPSPPPPQRKRICVMMSGRVKGKERVASFWRQFVSSVDAQVDFVMHLWGEMREELPRADFPVCAIRDDAELNSSVINSFVAPSNLNGFVLVSRHTEPDDVSRINSQMYGIAWVYAAAMLNAYLCGAYDVVVRYRLDYLPLKLDLAQLCLAPQSDDWIVFHRFACRFVLDGIFWGSQTGMRVCLAFDSRDDQVRKFILPRACLPFLKDLVAQNFVQSTKNKSLLRILHFTHTRHLPGDQMFYTPERVFPMIADEQGIRKIYIPFPEYVIL